MSSQAGPKYNYVQENELLLPLWRALRKQKRETKQK